MTEKSPRRLKLEQALREDPSDTFLRYGLALQCLREADVEEGRALLIALVADHPDDQVAAFQQLGQSFMDENKVQPARHYFQQGIALAERLRDAKAEGEMRNFLSQLD